MIEIHELVIEAHVVAADQSGRSYGATETPGLRSPESALASARNDDEALTRDIVKRVMAEVKALLLEERRNRT